MKNLTEKDIKDLLSNMQDNFVFPIGIKDNGEIVFSSLEKTPNLLIAGACGSGVSNYLNTLLIYLLGQNDEKNLKVMLIDRLGIDLNYFKDCKHIINNKLYKGDDVFKALDEMLKEMKQRYQLFTETKTKNINEYNKIAKEKLPRILIAISGYNRISQNSASYYEKLNTLAKLSHGAGIHLVITTQSINSRAINKEIKQNFPTKICFQTLSDEDSKLVLDCDIAAEYPKAPECFKYLYYKNDYNDNELTKLEVLGIIPDDLLTNILLNE